MSQISDEYLEASRALKSSSPIFVYVEGYDDVAFWRGVLDDYEDKESGRTFEISTPARDDRAKGKKVVLSFVKRAGKNLWLCVDSDFDYLFDGATPVSKLLNENKYVVQTKLYAIENLLCLPSSLSSLATKATKNDKQIFDFERFAAEYSRAIYPIFVWYYHAAALEQQHIVTISELKNIAKLNFLIEENNGRKTIDFIARQVKRKVKTLQNTHPEMVEEIAKTDNYLKSKGVEEDEVYLWVQGHFWQDNVVKIMLSTICKRLRDMMVEDINKSSLSPLHKKNELSAYNNTLRDISSVIADNTLYKQTVHYIAIKEQIDNILQ